MAAAQRAGSLDSTPQSRPRGRPRNDGRPAGTVGQEVFIDKGTKKIVPRPRGRPSNEFLRKTRQVIVPPGHDPGKYVQALLSAETGNGRADTTPIPAANDLQNHLSQPGASQASAEPAKRIRHVVQVMDSFERKTKIAGAGQASAAGISSRTAPHTDPAMTAALAPAGHANQNAGIRQSHAVGVGEPDALLSYLRARVDELTNQRDTWWEVYQQECHRNQEELNALIAKFDRLFELAENDIRALHDELALSFQGDR
jgi:hypothetical protein